jgi:hypothetical protein
MTSSATISFLRILLCAVSHTLNLIELKPEVPHKAVCPNCPAWFKSIIFGLDFIHQNLIHDENFEKSHSAKIKFYHVYRH